MAQDARRYRCEETLAHVDEFVDQELCAYECDRIDDHLRTCPACRDVFARHVELKSMVKKACSCDSVPQEVRQRVVERISQLRLTISGGTFESLTITTEQRETYESW